MPSLSNTAIEEAKKLDLLTYLKNYEPNELVRLNSSTYTTRTHDSLKISNGKWMWWSRGIGGYTALDYLMKVKGYAFDDAVRLILKDINISVPIYVAPEQHIEKELLLPDESASTDRVFEYLFGRGIDWEIIDNCLNEGLIIESLPYHNVVFVGFDEQNKARYAAYRSTNNKKIMGDCSGSKKEYSFRIADCNSTSLHVFESAIDLLSFATLMKMQGNDYHDFNMISLAGVYQPAKDIRNSKVPVAIQNYLKAHEDVDTVVLHLDNDLAGRSATKAITFLLKDKYNIVDSPSPMGKDFNDCLCYKLNLKTSQQRIERSEYSR